MMRFNSVLGQKGTINFKSPVGSGTGIFSSNQPVMAIVLSVQGQTLRVDRSTTNKYSPVAENTAVLKTRPRTHCGKAILRRGDSRILMK
jgi:hypothetical protein